jgi:hypothetical protein
VGTGKAQRGNVSPYVGIGRKTGRVKDNRQT